MSKQTYNLHLKGYVGGWDFDSDVVDIYLNKHQNDEIHVLIDSLGGSLAQALSIVASFKNHGNVHVHYVGMNASAATIASLGAKHVSIDSSAMYLVHKCSMEFFQWVNRVFTVDTKCVYVPCEVSSTHCEGSALAAVSMALAIFGQ